MDQHNIFTYLLLVPISLALLLIVARKRKEKNNPPGPFKLPFIGNLHQLGALPHQSFYHLSKKHGDVMFLELGGVPTVVISSAEAARKVLKDHDLDCCSRHPLAGPKRLSYNHLDIAFSPYNHRWREMRKICSLELFGARRAQQFRLIREEEVSSLVRSIGELSSTSCSVDLGEKAFALAASDIFKTAFGKAFEGSEFDDRRLQEVVAEAEAMLRSFFAADYFPYVGWIVDRITGLHARLEQSFHRLDAFYEYVIDDHLDPGRKKHKEDRDDIVDVLLRVEKEQRNSGGDPFTKDHIKAVLMDIFLAGVTTSAVAIIWAMAELAKNPRIMRKAQNEVRKLVGKKGKVTEGDIQELQYLKLVVKETLRLHPPAPLLLPRQVMSRFSLNNYDIHPKTRVEVNVWAIGRDPEHWDDPGEFYPERFIDSSVEYLGNHYELLPFGSGRRGCPGMYMGMALVELTIANLLYCFDWKLPNGMKEEDIGMEEAPGISAPKKTPLELVPIRFRCS